MASIDYGTTPRAYGAAPRVHATISGDYGTRFTSGFGAGLGMQPGALAQGGTGDDRQNGATNTATNGAPDASGYSGGGNAGRLSRPMRGLAALISLALLIGLGVWGYRLALRDVTGVPVVRALAGAMRVQPANPGGEFAANQGLAVNRLQAEGGAQPPANRLVLAPAPVGMLASDQAGLRPAPRSAALQAAARPTAQPVAPAAVSPVVSPVALATTAEQDAARGSVRVETAIVAPLLIDPAARLLKASVVVRPGAATAPLTRQLALVRAVPAPAPIVTVPPIKPALQIISASIKGVNRSPRPRPRPETITKPVLLAARIPVVNTRMPSVTTGPARAKPLRVKLAVAVGLPGQIDPATLTAGTRLAQLGAFNSSGLARGEWRRLIGRFPDYFDGKAPVIQKASSGGRQFFRLRAHGFANLNAARQFCAALQSEKAACIPVTMR